MAARSCCKTSLTSWRHTPGSRSRRPHLFRPRRPARPSRPGGNDMAIKEMIVKVVEGHSLRETEAAAAMLDIVEGLATPSQIAAFVVALRMKGETADEIAGLARVMRQYATRVDAGADVVDIVGTGGDG